MKSNLPVPGLRQTGRAKKRNESTKIEAICPLKRRLMDMGVLVGEMVKVKKISPLGDPIEVTIKNYNLSLRKKEAEGIKVEMVK